MTEVALKACNVSYVDLGGIEHTVEVTAGSLYEAIARRCRFFLTTIGSSIGRGQTAILVKVKHPDTEHLACVHDFERWLQASPRSPADMIFKNRLRELLAATR